MCQLIKGQNMAYVQQTLQPQEEILGSVVCHNRHAFQNVIASDLARPEKHIDGSTSIHISLYLYLCVYVCVTEHSLIHAGH